MNLDQFSDKTNPNGGVSDREFVKTWLKAGTPSLVATLLALNERNVYTRRRVIEAKYNVKLDVTNDLSTRRMTLKHDEGRADISITNGKVIVFSDAHFYPGVRTTAFRALLTMIRELRPVAVIANGDMFDGATISRYPRIGWDRKPSVKEELEAVTAAMDEVEEVCKEVGCSLLIWPLGNHDSRYETKLAAEVPQYEGIAGFHLKDHFPNWTACWTCWINDEVCVTHQYHNGIHATHNNLMKGQCHYVTGHLHSPKVARWTNARGQTLYAVDCGTLAEPMGPHCVDYQMGRHGNHRSGFAVLTFFEGRLLVPELVEKFDEDHVEFRGHVLSADSGEINFGTKLAA